MNKNTITLALVFAAAACSVEAPISVEPDPLATGPTVLFCDETARIKGTGYGFGRARANWGTEATTERQARRNARVMNSCNVAGLDAAAIVKAEEDAIDSCVSDSLSPWGVECRGVDERKCSLSVPKITCVAKAKAPSNDIRCDKLGENAFRCRCEAWTGAEATGLNVVHCE